MSLESGLTGFDYADCEFRKRLSDKLQRSDCRINIRQDPAAARYVVAVAAR